MRGRFFGRAVQGLGGARFLKSALVASLGVLSLGAVGCHGRGGSPDEKAEWVTERVADKLDLDASQKGKLATVKTQVLEAMKELKGTREAARATLREEVGKERMDAAKLTASVQASIEVISKRIPGVIASIVELHATLRPEQKVEVKEFAEKHP